MKPPPPQKSSEAEPLNNQFYAELENEELTEFIYLDSNKRGDKAIPSLVLQVPHLFVECHNEGAKLLLLFVAFAR